MTKTSSPTQYGDVKDLRPLVAYPLMDAGADSSRTRTIAIAGVAIGLGAILVIESPAPTPQLPSTEPVAHVEPWELGAPVVDASSVDTRARMPAPRSRQLPAPTSEAKLVAAAWQALSGDAPSRALALLKRDAHEYPNGVLAEECDALMIVALARLDRLPEATAAAKQFTQRFPNSIHRELVANAISGDNP